MTAIASPPLPADAATLNDAVVSMRKHAFIGYFAMLFAFVSPMAARLVFGVCNPLYFASTMLAFGLVTACAMAAMVFVFRDGLRRGLSLRRAGAVSLFATVPVMVVGYLVIALAQRSSSWFTVLDPTEPRTALYQVVTGVADSFPMIAAWAGLIKLPALLRMHEARGREMEGLRREAELLRLKAHLEPHFLLNTMNAIAGLVTEDQNQARELLGCLGDLLRDATSLGDRHSVTDELAWLERYVAIHRARFPGLFDVAWDVPPEVRAARIPALLLQPLVENAISHGVARLDGEGGHVVIHGRKTAASLVFEIRDNGRGPGPRRAGGKGLAIVTRRLELESQEGRENASFVLERDGEWTKARVTLPLPGGASC